jgi:hypothetical protein
MRGRRQALRGPLVVASFVVGIRFPSSFVRVLLGAGAGLRGCGEPTANVTVSPQADTNP